MMMMIILTVYALFVSPILAAVSCRLTAVRGTNVRNMPAFSGAIWDGLTIRSGRKKKLPIPANNGLTDLGTSKWKYLVSTDDWDYDDEVNNNNNNNRNSIPSSNARQLAVFVNATGDVELTQNSQALVIKGPGGGSFVAVAGDGSIVCHPIQVPPIDERLWFYRSESKVNYYQGAVQMTGGRSPVNEYYLDDKNREIHLNNNAASTRPPSANWFVSKTGEPAELYREPHSLNPKFIDIVNGPSLIKEKEAKELWVAYGDLSQMLGEYIWVTPDTGIIVQSSLPFFSESGTYAYGTAVAMRAVDGEVVTLSAASLAVVLSVEKLGEVNTEIPPMEEEEEQSTSEWSSTFRTKRNPNDAFSYLHSASLVMIFGLLMF